MDGYKERLDEKSENLQRKLERDEENFKFRETLFKEKEVRFVEDETEFELKIAAKTDEIQKKMISLEAEFENQKSELEESYQVKSNALISQEDDLLLEFSAKEADMESQKKHQRKLETENKIFQKNLEQEQCD